MICKTRNLTQPECVRYIRELESVSAEHAVYAAIGAIALGTGARIGEILRMRNGDVLNQDGEVMERLRRRVEKKRSQTVYAECYFLNPRLRAIVQRYADQTSRISLPLDELAFFFTVRYSGARISYRSAWEHQRVILKHAGINPVSEHIVFHGLRKTYATLVFRVEKELNGGDGYTALDAVRKYLGHETTRVTEKYLNLPPGADEKKVHEIASRKLLEEKALN